MKKKEEEPALPPSLQLQIMGTPSKSWVPLPFSSSSSFCISDPSSGEADSTVRRNATGRRNVVGEVREYAGRWFRPAMYTFLVVACQSAATLLGRLYYTQGGKSKWLGTLSQVVGFPILLPLLCFTNPKTGGPSPPPPPWAIPAAYVGLGILIGISCMMFSVGMQYLPVSTFSLLSAAQLAFMAVFSFFINSQRFTSFTLNSIVLLSISSVLLVLQTDEDAAQTNHAERGKYLMGFLSTVAASACFALSLSLTQLCFQKLLRRQDFRVMLHMLLFPGIAASAAVGAGLLGSGEWKGLAAEMEDFRLGKASYVAVLVSIAVCWQVFGIGSTGLVLEVSALAANVVSTFGLPVVPACAAVVFQEKMSGLKAVSMALAIWGFISYAYQHYLDDLESKDGEANLDHPLPPHH